MDDAKYTIGCFLIAAAPVFVGLFMFLSSSLRGKILKRRPPQKMGYYTAWMYIILMYVVTLLCLYWMYH